MILNIYQVDAFSNRLFGGNPAAVVPLDGWIEKDLMQSIAMENNLSETVFFVPEGDSYYIRWFTPTNEVRLCGHATVAAAHILWSELNFNEETWKLNSLSGPLSVIKKEDYYTLDFPSSEVAKVNGVDELEIALGAEVKEVYKGRDDYLAVLESQVSVVGLDPDFGALAKLDARGVIATAPGQKVDFVSRCFYPKYGVNEDPVTGSAHTLLAPYWASRLGKNELVARQLSKRGGELQLSYKGARTEISGQAITFMKGEITV